MKLKVAIAILTHNLFQICITHTKNLLEFPKNLAWLLLLDIFQLLFNVWQL